jgi:nucleoid-associated protein YgaU
VKRTIRALPGVAAYTVSWWALAVPGRAVLPAPPLLHPGALERWLASAGPTVAAFSILRVLAVAAGAGLALSVGVGVAGQLLEMRRPHTGATGRWRRLLVPAPAAALAALIVGTAIEPMAGAAPSDVVTMSVVAPTTAVVTRPVGTVPLLRSADVVPAAPSIWVVSQGGSFWSEATRVARAHGTDDRAAVSRYWIDLMAANRVADPDLVFPGSVFRLPPWPS